MRPPLRRLGALGLALLLQVFVLSGFIHPCCLDGGGEGGHAVHEAPIEGDGASGDAGRSGHEAHSGSMPAPVVHDGGSHAEHRGDDGATTAPQDGAQGDAEAAHEDDHSCGGCEGGNCGLCCQTAGVTFLPGPIPTVVGSEASPAPVRPARLATAILPAPPAFLLPFANAPPSPATVSI